MATFALQLAAVNKDSSMLEELWSFYQAYDLSHLNRMIEFIASEKWVQGLTIILKSFTTECIFRSLHEDCQIEIVTEWLRVGKE